MKHFQHLEPLLRVSEESIKQSQHLEHKTMRTLRATAKRSEESIKQSQPLEPRLRVGYPI